MTGAAAAAGWDRIATWLARHAPATAAAIRPPATAAALARVEATLGAPLPAEPRAWYERGDGMTREDRFPGAPIPPQFRPYPIEEALRVHATMLDVLGGAAEDGGWLPGWLPVAADLTGLTLLVDTRDGAVRQFDKAYGVTGAPRWTGVAAMLTEVATALERDTEAGGHRPEVDPEGRLGWRTPDGLWVDRFPLYLDGIGGRVTRLTTLSRAAPPDRATLVLARTARIVDALLATALALDAGGPTRYDDPDPADSPELRAYADRHGGAPGLADHLLAAWGALRERVAPYGQPQGEPVVPGRPPLIAATVRERGTVVIDRPVSWPGLVAGLDWYLHLNLKLP